MTVPGYPLEIEYTNDHATVDQWLARHSAARVLGFDTETTRSFPGRGTTPKRRGPATLQLASEGEALVIHLAQWPREQCWPESLLRVLSDATVLKAGVGVEDDVLELFRADPLFRVHGRVDLGLVGADSAAQRVSLKRLARSVLLLKGDIPKSKAIACSNWSRKVLEEKQIEYAARDAWAGSAVLTNLLRRRPPPNCELEDDFERSLEFFLASEISIEELDSRAKIRKVAKDELKIKVGDLRSRPAGPEDDYYATQKLKLTIADLQTVIQNNRASPLIYFKLETTTNPDVDQKKQQQQRRP